MGIFSKAPAAAERKAFDVAEQRLQQVSDKLTQVQRDLSSARARLAALAPGDLTDDLDAAAAAFAAEHGQLSARIAFLQHARERLTGELAAGRRAVLQAESAIDEALKAHFAAAADDRLRRLAGTVGEEIEALAVELCRAAGHRHDRVDMDGLMGAIKGAIVASGRVSQDFGVGLAYAETATPKIPAAPKSQLLDGDHRSGRNLDRLNPPVDVRAIRTNLQSLDAFVAEHRHSIVMLGRDPAQASKIAKLQKLVDDAEQSRAELEQQLEQALEQKALAA